MFNPSLRQLDAYLRNRVKELQPICRQTNPWVFVCGAAFIEYLSKLAYGKGGGKTYKDFVRNFFPAAYKNFTYKRHGQVLPEQMYHVLRCGILHPFSLIPDPYARSKGGGRRRSIVLAHRAGASKMGIGHLSPYSSRLAPNSCLFVAEDFLADIEGVVKKMLSMAKRNQTVRKKLLTWTRKYPPISGKFESGRI